MKTCTKCKSEKPLAEFNKLSKSADGLQYHCKSCKAAYQQANPNRSAVVAKYREANKAVCIARSVVSQQKKREYYTAKTVEWQRSNPDKVKAIKQRMKDKIAAAGGISAEKRADKNAKAAEYRATNPEKVAATLRVCRVNWEGANPEARNAARLKRRSTEKALSKDDYWVLKEAVKLCRMREKMVGGKWHVDHIIPVSKGGTSCPDNIQVVPALWNMAKSNRHSNRFLGGA